MEPTKQDWERLGDCLKKRMDELSLGYSDVEARGGPSDKSMRGYRVGLPIARRDVKRRLAEALEWPSNAIDRILAGDDPLTFDVRAEGLEEFEARILEVLESIEFRIRRLEDQAAKER